MLLTHYWGRQGLCRRQIPFYPFVFFYQSAEYFSMLYRGLYSHTPFLWGRTQQWIGTLSSLPHGLFIQLGSCLEGGGSRLTLLLDGSHSNWSVKSSRVRCGTLVYTLFSCHLLGIATRYKFLWKKAKKMCVLQAIAWAFCHWTLTLWLNRPWTLFKSISS
jgi:hypothetical protein